MRNEIEFLVDDGDAGSFGLERGGVLHLHALVQDGAITWLVHTADDFHQRRFSRPVLTTDSMHLAAAQIEMHIRQGFDARELLADIFETQKGRTLRARHLLRRVLAPNCRCALRHLETSHPYPRSTGVMNRSNG